MKSIKKLVKTVISIIFILCLTTFMAGLTSCEPTTREDVIPETLGEREGLYLYYNNYRSFTDGTQTERLVNDITVDGVTYTTDEYYINDIQYMINTKEIIYSITTKKYDEYKYFLWHYNYDTKESGLIRSFTNYVMISVSDLYLFAQSRDPRTDTYLEGVLYDTNLNVVEDELSGYQLYKDMLYNVVEPSLIFKWYKNGKFFKITTSDIFWLDNIVIRNNYAYLFPKSCIYLIDLNTGEYNIINYSSNESLLSCTIDYYQTDTSGNNVYCISYTKLTEGKWETLPLHTGCYLWRMNKLNAERIFAFPSHLEVNFTQYCNDKYINFKTVYAVKYSSDTNISEERGSAYFDVENNKYIMNKRMEIPKEEKNFCVGEYEFYVDYKVYGALFNPDLCYYLHRVKDGKDEILQYYLEQDRDDLNPLMFDDIYVK